MTGYKYSEIKPTGAKTPEALHFDLFLGERTIPVSVSREALEDHSKKTGIRFADLAYGMVEYLQTYQPEFGEIAANKVRAVERVMITSEDIANL